MKSLFLFDLDGVFYKGKESRVNLGGQRALARLRELDKQVFVLTNNSTDSVETVHSRLKAFDVRFRRDEILTSGLLTAEYLSRRYGKVSYFLVGERGLESEMRKYGHRRSKGERADCVVVGLDRQVTYEKLDHAARLVRGGSRLVATHASALYMYKTGPAMATGPLVKAIEYAAGRRATVVGKPSPLMFKIALQRAGCGPSDSVMVGDQLDTDILGASRAGIDAILVTTGVDKEPGSHPVLAVLDNVDDLVGLL